MNRTIYISIGNSDDKLTQVAWSKYWIEMSAMVISLASATHGAPVPPNPGYRR